MLGGDSDSADEHQKQVTQHVYVTVVLGNYVPYLALAITYIANNFVYSYRWYFNLNGSLLVYHYVPKLEEVKEKEEHI